MGGSLRRHKKSKPVILKAKKNRKKNQLNAKSRVPDEVAAQRMDLQQRLGVKPEWCRLEHTAANMERLGLVADANAGHGRNAKADAVMAAVEADPSVLEREPDDDELKAALSKARSTGAAQPKRLTPRQRAIVERLLARHSNDVAAMARDRELNSMQHSEGVLHKLIQAYRYWKSGSGVDFRVPQKRLW